MQPEQQVCSADCTRLTIAIDGLTTTLEKLTTQLATSTPTQQRNFSTPQRLVSAPPFLNAWWDCLSTRDVTASDLCRIINGQQCQVLTQTATDLFGSEGNLTGNKLGNALRMWSQRAFDGFCVLNTGNKAKGRVLWRLERTQ